MNDVTDFEKAKIKRDAKKIAKVIKNTPLHHRAYLFTGMANYFDAYGEVPMATLFARIASTYIRKKAGDQQAETEEKPAG